MTTADYWFDRAEVAQAQADRARTPEERQHAQENVTRMMDLALEALADGARGRALRASQRNVVSL